MDLGVIIGDVPTTVGPREHLDHLLAQVEAAQRAGVRYITIGQHFLYGDHRWLQPIPTLARLAAEVSPDTRLVTTVVLLPLYHPVALAEDLATLDIVSAGRLIVGVGLGYRTVEYRNLGVPFDERVARFEEGLDLMKRLWTEPHVEHHGRFFDVDGHTPHPALATTASAAVWVGAQAAAGVRRSARLGDAWPIGPNATPDEVERLLGVYVDGATPARASDRARQPFRRDVAFGSSRQRRVRRVPRPGRGAVRGVRRERAPRHRNPRVGGGVAAGPARVRHRRRLRRAVTAPSRHGCRSTH